MECAMQGIAEWLASIGLGEYAERFAENAVDFAVLPDLTEQDLKDLGVKLGHRRKLLRAISELDQAARAPAEAARKPPPRHEAERRQLSIMFCDLVGSTALTARLDPEDMWRVIASYHDCISDIISHYGGKIARYMGDGVLIYFGYPQAREDDAVEAVRAALALVDAIPNLRTDADGALQARIGLATGTVVVSELLIDEAPVEQATVGETPNLAARLQALAEPGSVLICPQTRRLSGGHFNYRDLGPVALKGWDQAVPVWQVTGTSDVESRFAAMHGSKLPPLLGREEEIELLLRRWRHVAQGEGRVVLLTGEPGIGKSHIALTFEQRLQDEAPTTVRYFCSPHHINSALFPFISQLERAAGFGRSDTPAEKLSKLDALVSRSTADAEHLTVLANLFALPANGQDKLQEVAPQKRKVKTFAGSDRGAGCTAPAVHDFRGCPLDRPNLAGAACRSGGACAQASGLVARHRQAGIYAALAEVPAHHQLRPHAPCPQRRRGIDRASSGRQETAEGGDGRNSRPNRWHPHFHRGADQDAAGRRDIAGTR
jgi:class 3 adenylate cyclase